MADSNLKTAGKGFLFITGAKVYFLFASTVVVLFLPRLFGSAALYGLYRVINGVLNVLTMVFVTATIQVASRFASSGHSPRAVLNTGFKAAALIGLPVALLLALLSGPLSTGLLHDPQAKTPLMIAAIIVAAYSFYAVVIGVFNGIKHFGTQAAFDVVFATLKTALILGMVAAGFGVIGAFTGFSSAAVIILILALIMAALRLPKDAKTDAVPLKEYLLFGAPLVAYFFVLNMFLQGDVISLKSLGFAPIKRSLSGANLPMDLFFTHMGLSTSPALIAGLSRATASGIAGVFGAAKNVAMIPYQAVISITFVVFPFISNASALGNKDKAVKQATTALRAALILSGLAVAVLGSSPAFLLRLLFGHAYAKAGPFLAPTLLSVLLFAFMFVSNSLLVGIGKPRYALIAGGTAMLVQVALLQYLDHFADPLLLMGGASVADIAGALVGGLLAWYFLNRSLGRVRIAKTLMVTALLGLVLSEAISRTGLSGITGLLVSWALGIVFYMALVILTRVVTPDDLSGIKKVFKKNEA